MTGVGVLLGTAAYMSPGAGAGKPVDRRADIWAFGCVLYEMLTGRRAFDGEDVSLTLSQILQREPALDALPGDVPARVRQTVQFVLEKVPERTPDRHRHRAPDAGWGVRDDCRSGDGPRRDRRRRLATGGPFVADRLLPPPSSAASASGSLMPARGSGPHKVVRFALPASADARAAGHRRRPPRPCDLSPRDASRVLGGRKLHLRALDHLDDGSCPSAGPRLRANRSFRLTVSGLGFTSGVNSSECPSAAGAPIALGTAENPWGASLGRRWSDPVRARCGRHLAAISDREARRRS